MGVKAFSYNSTLLTVNKQIVYNKSVENERSFSSTGLFVTKIYGRLRDSVLHKVLSLKNS